MKKTIYGFALSSVWGGCHYSYENFYLYATKVMQTIIQERGDTRGLITLFSSNNGIMDSETLSLYGDRGVSRLRKMCNYYELVGRDRRIK